MKSILLTLSQGFLRKLLLVCLMTLLSLSGLLIFVSSPVYAATSEETQLVPSASKPTADEKIDRAYDMSPATGFLEETKQQLGDPNKNFDYNKKANVKNIIKSDKADSQPGLVEKAKGLVERVTGKE
jgi:hypothetical protein